MPSTPSPRSTRPSPRAEPTTRPACRRRPCPRAPMPRDHRSAHRRREQRRSRSRSTRRSRRSIGAFASIRSGSAPPTRRADWTGSAPTSLLGREPQGGQVFGGGGGGGGGFRRGIDEDTLKQVADLDRRGVLPRRERRAARRRLRGLPTNLILKHDVVEIGVGFVAFSGLAAALALMLGRAWRPLP